MEKAVFGAGCFWGVELAFKQLKGVTETRAGYAGGALANPSYEQVCSGATGHAEVVQVTFDEAVIPYKALLDAFFQMHDPTTLNRQGPDVGTQYRSVIFAANDAQLAEAKAVKAQLDASGEFSRPIVTEILPAVPFYAAEEYHQDYFRKHGVNASCHFFPAK